MAAQAPTAVLCLDPFHVIQWAMKALDKVRTRTLATQAGPRDRNLMWAVRKNPANLTTGQKTTLVELEAVNATLFRAYLLEEQLREVFRRKGAEGHALLSGWILWARYCGIAEFESSAAQSKDTAR